MSKTRDITGVELKAALERMLVLERASGFLARVRLFLGVEEMPRCKIGIQAAILRVKSGHYHGRIKGDYRVVSIREYDPRAIAWVAGWRNTRGGCIVPPIGWDADWSDGLAGRKPSKTITPGTNTTNVVP